MGRIMSLFGQSPLKMSFEKCKSRFLDVSPEVRNIPHLFHAAIWSQKKVVLQKRECNAWLDQPGTPIAEFSTHLYENCPN